MTKTVRALKEKILAEMIDKPGVEKTTAGGIIIKDNDMTESSVRPRWFKVYSVGNGIDWITKGKYVLVDHGRWSNGMKVSDDLKLYLLDNKDCLAASDDNPMDDNSSIKISAKAIPKRPSGDTSRQIR
jgi:co-chaperonin GroES (HSP10)|tara:strand:- start:1304 stop:1687 length:384 start_codon:yes stop_codon:yes gene_type:complete